MYLYFCHFNFLTWHGFRYGGIGSSKKPIHKLNLKTMKKISLFFAGLLTVSMASAQFTHYRPGSNAFAGDIEKSTLNLELSYEFNNMQIQGTYAFSSNLFLTAVFNTDFSSVTIKPMLGPDATQERDIKGGTFALGYYNFSELGMFNHLELLGGYSYQDIHTTEFPKNTPETEDKTQIHQIHHRVFAQFNAIQSINRIEWGPSLKTTFLTIPDFTVNNQEYLLQGKSTLVLEPSVSFNYKLLKSQRLRLTSQVGVYTALFKFKNVGIGA